MLRIRLIPIVLFATASLLTLKAGGIVVGSGYTLGGLPGAKAQGVSLPPPQPHDSAPAEPARPQPRAKRSWAQDILGYPDITGSVGNEPAPAVATPAQPATQTTAQKGRAPSRPMDGTPVTLDERSQMSAGERAILERLQERRQELEARSRELDIRDGLLRAAEKRIEGRLDELKQIEAQIKTSTKVRDEAETARLKSLVTIYESMKAKDAARIFDRLDLRVLVDVAVQVNPRRMSEILAQMTPEAAERLTVELAARATKGAQRPPSAADLPKIEGRPRT